MTRDELVKEITLIKGASQHGMFGYLSPIEAGYIADFILADRKRIVEPLSKLLLDDNRNKQTNTKYHCLNAMKQTLKNAGEL